MKKTGPKSKSTQTLSPHVKRRPRNQNYAWTAKAISLLGKMTDVAAAKKLGIAKFSCYLKRTKLGIPRFEFVFTESEIALLGTDTDEAIAKKIGATLTRCWRKRTELGIPAFSVTYPLKLAERLVSIKCDRDAGMSKAEIGRKYGITRERARQIVSSKAFAELEAAAERTDP